MIDGRAIARRLHADALRRAIDVGVRAANYAKKFAMFSEPTRLSELVDFLRPRLIDNHVGVFVSSNALRVRKDAIFTALRVMQHNLPGLAIVDERLSIARIEFCRRITEDEQRRMNLERDRLDVDKLVTNDERRLATYLQERRLRPRVATMLQLPLQSAPVDDVPANAPQQRLRASQLRVTF